VGPVALDDAFRAFADSLGVAVVVSDADGVVAFCNGVADELFTGLLTASALPFVGSRVSDHGWRLLREDASEVSLSSAPAGRARSTGEAIRDEVIGLVVGERSPRWMLQSAVPLGRPDASGRFAVVSTFVDITARRELEARLAQRAAHDPLTGLANRDRFEERLAEAALRCGRGGRTLALLFVDLDDFKGCNDLYGHAAGDGALVAVADRLRSLVRPTDTVARLGGDEFAIVVEGADVVRAGHLADAITAAFDRPIATTRAVHGADLNVGASVGVALLAPGGDVVALQLAADEALFAAKHAGKGTAVVHDAAAPRPVAPSLVVSSEDARAWARYIDDLRAEIALRKADGTLPDSAGAPDPVYRVLRDVLARIARLPASGEVVLELPRERDLGPFLFHQTHVEGWVEQLRSDGVLTVRAPARATRFWSSLREVAGSVTV
jgi:diguanylate cyclase (GGDEF)-like protein